jgi:hypothetical protein
MKGRDFIALLGGAAAAGPRVARAQHPERMRRIGVLNAGDENDSKEKTDFSASTQALAGLGWIELLKDDSEWRELNGR